MATKPLLLLALLTVYCEAGRLSVLYNEYSDGSGPITISVMDPSSGSVDGPDARTVAFPASTCTPGWSLSNGTHGQTSSVFAMNQTVFILAQETCTDPSTGITSYANTTVFGMFAGIFEDFAAREWWAHSELRMDPDDFRPYAELSNLTDNVLDMNINWDHTANVLLVAPAPPPASPDRSTPRRDGMPQRMQILEISEYDGEVRPKAVYNASPPCGYPKPAGGCWGRVNGLSTVDFHSSERLAALRASRHLDPRPLRARFREEHCENCSFYYLEEQIQYGTTPVEGAARNLIGRRVQTGSVTLNITDPTNLLSLQFYVPEYGVLDLPQSGAFFGVGVCCELAWCPPDCEGHGGEVALVGWTPSSYAQPSILAVVPAHSDEQTAQLGLALDVQGFPLNPPAPDRELRASIMAGGRVWSFNISGSGDNHEFLRASLLETSPPLTRKLNAWWYAGF